MELIRTPSGVAIQNGSSGDRLVPIRHIIGIGLNYADHAKEQGGQPPPERPVMFTKSPMAACLSGDDIRVPVIAQDPMQVDFEGELGVIVAGPCRDVPEDEALSAVLGYVVANDVSARWWQKQGSGGQFYRGKSFDTFCPIGPSVIPASKVPDPQKLTIKTKVNGMVMQDSSTAEMIFPVAKLVHEVSRGITLLPGTLILTGTPSGVGMARKPQVWLKHGDEVEVEIGGVGVLRNRVVFE